MSESTNFPPRLVTVSWELEASKDRLRPRDRIWLAYQRWWWGARSTWPSGPGRDKIGAWGAVLAVGPRWAQGEPSPRSLTRTGASSRGSGRRHPRTGAGWQLLAAHFNFGFTRDVGEVHSGLAGNISTNHPERNFGIHFASGASGALSVVYFEELETKNP